MEELGFLIPILAISIPLVAVTGRVIVQPLVEGPRPAPAAAPTTPLPPRP